MNHPTKKALRASLVEAKKNIETAIKLLDKDRPLGAYASLNMGVASACKAQLVFSDERLKAMLLSGQEACRKDHR